ncbi:MAG: GatB/YqeY domain-containing protein, partial [Candidatus Hodarchaeaceae archaeon]|nr:GatB/YqeY domain-containing protein [Candidatus Hodarchaeaceae archaeon]
AQGPSVREAVEKLGLTAIERPELERLVAEVVAANRKLVDERGAAAMAPLMGMVMEEVRGRADGKLVHELLERELKKKTGGKP